jgi:N6-L-threonylcarbamoyladenine synthase
MKILSIETSCDDTGISIMEARLDSARQAKGDIQNATFKILANNSNSQIEIHIPYGGVYPMLAKREHMKNLPILLEASLKEAKLNKKKKPVDVIAVTYGPGLEPALWAGIVFAKELAKKWKLPLVPVNHMEGHLFSVFGKDKKKFKILKIKNPTLALLVSGGHTELVLIKKWLDYKIIGQTLDDAVGEAFDKVARMLGLPYPGGPQISKLAEIQRAEEKQDLKGVRSATGARFQQFSSKKIAYPEKLGFSFALPRPMLYTKNFNFSFSGLKTAVLYLIKKIGPLNREIKSKIALEFENAAIECLIYKTAKALEKYKIKTLIVAGGVSANKHLKSEIKKITGDKIKLFFPTKELAMDNSLMIGIAGYLNYIKNKKKVPKIDNIKATGNLRL